ncbi:hypothetical protein ACO22_05865 [Paracoccidioides brasiliensis]|uniref:Uncharacterized protein n=1 Tax=Paracoccidioides brasiliensis TaxID=121759 RepID=A0A1D2J913_PARBR|nr:hypothetical protein ACO22_05865 [Paracoccidioides brasiliensis]
MLSSGTQVAETHVEMQKIWLSRMFPQPSAECPVHVTSACALDPGIQRLSKGWAGEVVLSYEGHRERESTHPVDRCMLHPPLPGLTGKGTIRLKVDGPVRTGDQHSAQLVTVHMVDKTPEISDSIPTDKYLVAKLYDPLYFDHEQDDVDPFRYTDLAYSHETAAYRLLCPLEGTVIPRYYGSFTL